MTPDDVTDAVAWQNRTGLKLNMVYNMGGVDEFGAAGPLTDQLGAAPAFKNAVPLDQPHAPAPEPRLHDGRFIAKQITQNQTRFDPLLGPVAAGLNDPTEVVTGEHSGLANVRPGNPGTIDPPVVRRRRPRATGGTLAGRHLRLRDHGQLADRRDGRRRSRTVTVAAATTARRR